jgi:hypothetical protein
VAVEDEESPAVGGVVHIIFTDSDVAVAAEDICDKLVVVSGYVNDLRAFSGAAEEFLQNIVETLAPMDAAAQRPKINEVPDNVKFVAAESLEEFQQPLGIAGRGAHVQVADPDGSVAMRAIQRLLAIEPIRFFGGRVGEQDFLCPRAHDIVQHASGLCAN